MFSGVEEIKRVMYETVKSHEVVVKLEEKNIKLDLEITKLYESIINLRKVYTEQLSNQKNFDANGFTNRVEELENTCKVFKDNIDELKGDYPFEHGENIEKIKEIDKIELDQFTQKENPFGPSSSINAVLSFREFVKGLALEIKKLYDKIDKLNNRIDLINAIYVKNDTILLMHLL